MREKIIVNNTFDVLKLIKPFWYFHLNYKVTKDTNDFESLFKLDKNYESLDSAKLEMKFILLMNGFNFEKERIRQLSLSEIEHKPSIKDEFRFLRKHFNVGWSLVYLFYCLITFNKPFLSVLCFFKMLRINNKSNLPYNYGSVSIKNNIKGDFFKKNPRIRIIIPTFNRYDCLDTLLNDLQEQDYSNFAITIVDQSIPFNKSFYEKFDLDMNLICQKKPALWSARNKAISDSDEEVIALLDDDSRINSDWISKHLQCLDFYNADVSAGISISSYGSAIPKNYAFYRMADQFDTGNAMLHRYVFKSCGLFDEQYEGMRKGDAEFGIRIFRNGFLSISNPEAKRIHLKHESGGLRQMGSWDSLRPTNIFHPRPIPSVLYFSRTYFGEKRALKYLISSVPFSMTNLKNKSKKFYIFISAVLSLLFLPLILIQIFRSWIASTKMLREGPKIPKIV